MSSKKNTPSLAPDAPSTLVPKLRFPEFRDEPGWVLQRLGLALKFQAGFPFPSKGFNDSGNGLRLIRNRDLRSDESVIYFSGEFDVSFIVNDGDVLIGMDGDFTPTLWQKGESLLNQRVGRVLAKGNNNHRFLLYLLTNSLRVIEEATARTTVKHLSHSAVENKFEFLPVHEEQKKIASCLSSLDELITAQRQKVEALKTHKKGLMHQLFPCEGETQPRLRFPEFEGEWEEKTLGSVCNSFSGGTPSTSKPHYYGGHVPFIRSAEIDRTGTELFLTSEGLANSSAKMVIKGDVLVALYGANSGDVALAKVEGAINQAILCLRSENSNAFIYQWLSLKKAWIITTYLQGGQGNLSGEIVKSIALGFPSLQEQQRIASCLSSLDELITNESNKLDVYKTHKKGLMQGLFPKAEENN